MLADVRGLKQAQLREGRMSYAIDVCLPPLQCQSSASGEVVEGDGVGDYDAGGSGGARGRAEVWSGEARQWTVYKRYSDFDKLRKILLQGVRQARPSLVARLEPLLEPVTFVASVASVSAGNHTPCAWSAAGGVQQA